MGFLSAGNRHGYELKREHDQRFPAARPLAYGQVYATLERLRKKQFVSPTKSEQAEGPERKVYALTEAGSEELTRWMNDVEVPTPYITNPFATKATVSLLVNSEDAAVGYLQRQRETHLARMRELTQTKTRPEATITEVLAADYAIAHLNADIRWLETALKRVQPLNQELHLEEPKTGSNV